MRIFKYPITSDRFQPVWIQRGSKILSIQLLNGELQLWALVDPAQPMEIRQLARYYTGSTDVPTDPGEYIATVQSEHGDHVDHFFDLGETGSKEQPT